jgi:hypothetical protein
VFSVHSVCDKKICLSSVKSVDFKQKTDSSNSRAMTTNLTNLTNPFVQDEDKKGESREKGENLYNSTMKKTSNLTTLSFVCLLLACSLNANR